MSNASVPARLFYIEADTPRQKRRGRFLQILIVALALIGLVSTFARLFFPAGERATVSLFIRTLSILLLSTVCLYALRRGRIIPAAHIFFLTLNAIFFFALTRPQDHPEIFPFLLLISVVAIALLHSIRASVVYFIVFNGAAALYLQATGHAGWLHFLVSLGLASAAWILAYDLERNLHTTSQMAADLQAKTETLERRTGQLRLSAEVGQVASASLDVDQLMRDVVTLIRDQFGFYHAAILLLDDSGSYAVLREATGKVGEVMKARPHRLAVASDSLIGWVTANRQPRIVSDVASDPVHLENPLLPDTRSEVALPLIARGQLLGVLDVQSRDTNAFQEEDVAILQLMASQVATSIDNAQLFTQTQSRLNEIEALFSVSSLLSTTLDITEIYRRTARAFAEQLDGARSAVSTFDAAEQTITTQVAFVHDTRNDVAGEYEPGPRTYPLDDHPHTRTVLQTQEPAIRYAQDTNLQPEERAVLEQMDYTSALQIPMVAGNQTLGVIDLYRHDGQPSFDQFEIQLAVAMGRQAAIALSNARMATQARSRAAQLSTLNRVSRALAAAPDLQSVYDNTRREILSLTQATGMSVLLLTDDRQHLDWAYGYEYGAEVDVSGIVLPISQGFSGYVARTREPLLINEDFEEKHEEVQSITVGQTASSWLGVPLIVTNDLIGVLSVENADDPDAFDDADVELLTTISGAVATAANNLRQLQQTQEALVAQSEQSLHLQTAAAVAAAASSLLDATELMQTAVTLIQERFGLYYVGLFLIDERADDAVLRAATGRVGRQQIGQGYRLSLDTPSLIGHTARDGEARIVQDVAESEERLDEPLLPNTKSEVALPLKVRDRIIGVLSVQSATTNDFSPGLISTLRTMSNQLAIAISNAQLLARTEARVQQQQRLNEVSTRLHRSADVETIIGTGLQALSRHFGGVEITLDLGRPGTVPSSGNGGDAPDPDTSIETEQEGR